MENDQRQSSQDDVGNVERESPSLPEMEGMTSVLEKLLQLRNLEIILCSAWAALDIWFKFWVHYSLTENYLLCFDTESYDVVLVGPYSRSRLASE